MFFCLCLSSFLAVIFLHCFLALHLLPLLKKKIQVKVGQMAWINHLFLLDVRIVKINEEITAGKDGNAMV